MQFCLEFHHSVISTAHSLSAIRRIFHRLRQLCACNIAPEMLRATTNHEGEFCLCARDFASRHLRDDVCGALANNLPSKAMVFAISLATHPALMVSSFRLSTHRSSMICLSLGLGAMSNSSMLIMFLISSTLPSATGSSGNSSWDAVGSRNTSWECSRVDVPRRLTLSGCRN